MDRFTAKIWRSRGSDCWVWVGAYSGSYGGFRVGDRVVGAHRFAYELWVGPIPEGLLVIHDCDDSRCVNPAHLRVGTHRDNMADRRLRRRRKSTQRR